MRILLIRSLIIGGLLAAGPALVLACDHEHGKPRSSTSAPATANAGTASGMRWL
ncbi:MAG TPA: hypothetical protein VHU80_09625 [Polyangiaceae bacterium]|nr:hypothetical protein [Polyangiaceae bacterium]